MGESEFEPPGLSDARDNALCSLHSASPGADPGSLYWPMLWRPAGFAFRFVLLTKTPGSLRPGKTPPAWPALLPSSLPVPLRTKPKFFPVAWCPACFLLRASPPQPPPLTPSGHGLPSCFRTCTCLAGPSNCPFGPLILSPLRSQLQCPQWRSGPAMSSSTS